MNGEIESSQILAEQRIQLLVVVDQEHAGLTGSSKRHASSLSVVQRSQAAAGEVQHEKCHYETDDNGRKHFDPDWCRFSADIIGEPLTLRLLSPTTVRRQAPRL